MFSRLIVVLVMPLMVIAGSARSADIAADLVEALQLREAFGVMAAEGEAYGREIEAEMFPGAGGSAWAASVAQIYAVESILPQFTAAFSSDLARSKSDASAALGFFQSDLGRRVTTLEVSARRALLDVTVEDASRLKLEEMQAARDPRLELIEEFVSVNDLVEANVTGALNASYAFYLGLAEAGAFGGRTDQEGMLGDVWAQEPSIRHETDSWIHSYLVMAYAPLSDNDLKEYIAFSRTDAGRDLNRALFYGFDTVFVDVSRKLGRAAGRILAGRDL